jgi:hypothetical protein
MTTVYLTNADNDVQTNKYYIKIYPTKIETDLAANTGPLEYPRAPQSQDVDSKLMFIDLQRRTKAVTVAGYIDKYSKRASNWAADAAHDAGVVKLMLEQMADRGGVNKMYVGTAADGYYDITDTGVDNNIIEGKITKIKVTEVSSDHIDRTEDSEDYPSASRKIVDKYEVTIQIMEGEDYKKPD